MSGSSSTIRISSPAIPRPDVALAMEAPLDRHVLRAHILWCTCEILSPATSWGLLARFLALNDDTSAYLPLILCHLRFPSLLSVPALMSTPVTPWPRHPQLPVTPFRGFLLLR